MCVTVTLFTSESPLQGVWGDTSCQDVPAHLCRLARGQSRCCVSVTVDTLWQPMAIERMNVIFEFLSQMVAHLTISHDLICTYEYSCYLCSLSPHFCSSVLHPCFIVWSLLCELEQFSRQQSLTRNTLFKQLTHFF